jgi:hypothetical protein
MSLPLIQINGKCDVPFFLCISAKNFTLSEFNKERKITKRR